MTNAKTAPRHFDRMLRWNAEVRIQAIKAKLIMMGARKLLLSTSTTWDLF